MCESDDDEGESRDGNQRKQKGNSFGVESKVFEVGVEERKVREGFHHGSD